MKILSVLSLACCLLIPTGMLSAGSYPDVSVGAEWNVDGEVKNNSVLLKEDKIAIVGNGYRYMKASVDVPAKGLGDKFYFVADFQFKNLTFGKNAYDRPKLKVYVDGQSKGAYNINKISGVVGPDGYTEPQKVALKCKLQLTGSETVTFEVASQSCAGEVLVSNARIQSKK